MFITQIKKVILGTTVVASFLALSTGTTRGDVVTRAEAAPCVTVPSFTVSTYPFISSTIPAVVERVTDPVGPFPLSALVPFPWGTIEGIWMMKLPDGTSLHFSFEVQSDCDGRKVVRVLGFEQKSLRVVAEGVGLGFANDMMVRAAMTSATSQYMVYIRQFRVPAGKASGRVSTVVTIRPFGGDVGNDVHMIARKASTLTLPKYIEKQQREIAEKRQAHSRHRTGR